MIGLAYVSNGQDTISNPNSIDKIPYYEQLYRFRVNRVIDLNEKQNAGFNSPKSSITKLIVDLLRGGKLHTFGSNVGDPADFQDKMADTLAFNLNTNFVRSGTQGEFDPNRGYLAGDLVFAPFTNADGSIEEHQYRILVDINAPAKGQKNTLTSANSVDNGPEKETLSAQKVVGLELIEDVIFDKRRSRLYYDILAIGVELQDDNNNAEGKMVSRFYIPYKEFAKEMGLLAHSKDLNERRRVQWQNRYNPSEGKTFLDAFRLRLFHGVIRKVENPDDMTIQRIFENNGRSYSESVFARWEEEMKLMEKEHNLWEY
ncbi:MAG TPA: hypothetical protein DGG95_04845 [Cytophagales bacterium]|nr:hypothetical protein [Cytophagales bacterium]